VPAPDGDVAIRPATAAEATLLAAVRNEAFDDYWAPDSLQRLIALPGTLAYFAFMEKQPVGCLLLTPSGDVAEVAFVSVLATARRRGIGRQLMRRAMSDARETGYRDILLEVADDNIAAIALYEDIGFVEIGVRRKYYSRRNLKVDARMMTRIL